DSAPQADSDHQFKTGAAPPCPEDRHTSRPGLQESRGQARPGERGHGQDLVSGVCINLQVRLPEVRNALRTQEQIKNRREGKTRGREPCEYADVTRNEQADGYQNDILRLEARRKGKRQSSR